MSGQTITAGPHAIVTTGSVTFAYDDNGNRISRTESGNTTGYTYDDDNRLAAVDLPSDPDDVEFVYDADGVRVSRIHGDYSTVSIAGLMEIDYDDTTVTETRTFYAFAGTPVAVRTHEDPATVYVFDNHLGSVTAAWDDTNDTHTLQRYYPFGADRGSTGALPSDHRYTGQISDDTNSASGGTGLLFYNARYYDPEVGAFVAADTIVPDPTAPADLNRYAYVRENPINYSDPTGHWCVFGKNPGGGCRGGGIARRVGGLAREAGKALKAVVWDIPKRTLQYPVQLLQYQLVTLERWLRDPLQALVDVGTLTALSDFIAFHVGFALGGNIEMDGCPTGAVCQDGVPFITGDDAATYGHVIHIRDDPGFLDPILMNHERQHMADVEDRGGVPYWLDYYVFRHGDYYEDRAHRAESGELVDRLFGPGNPLFGR